MLAQCPFVVCLWTMTPLCFLATQSRRVRSPWPPPARNGVNAAGRRMAWLRAGNTPRPLAGCGGTPHATRESQTKEQPRCNVRRRNPGSGLAGSGGTARRIKSLDIAAAFLGNNGTPQAASRKPQAASRRPQAASRKPQACKPQAASRKPQAASRKPQAASRKPQYCPRLTLPA